MNLDRSRPHRVAYLVHDLHDAAVQRRFDLLTGEGLDVRLGGFRRHRPAVARASGKRALDLGLTMDARLLRRLGSVLRHLLWPRAISGLCQGASVIMARNLEMLVLALRVKGKGQRLVYECLDLHRLMLGSDMKSRLMRRLERWLLARTDLVVVSSPAFAEEYFSRQGRLKDILLVENKVALPPADGAPARLDKDGAIVLGWFGMLRCRRSLVQLQAIIHEAQGRVKVVIAGVASPAEFPDFEEQVATSPGVTYLGPYASKDLADLYARVDYIWAIDYFEEGLNSDWLLPNRLYEGIAHGVTPIALRSVETGRWLERHRLGLLVDDPVVDLAGKLLTLSDEAREEMRQHLRRLPREAVIQTARERRAIALAVVGCSDA